MRSLQKAFMKSLKNPCEGTEIDFFVSFKKKNTQIWEVHIFRKLNIQKLSIQFWGTACYAIIISDK